jgi:hypothetical protein
MTSILAPKNPNGLFTCIEDIEAKIRNQTERCYTFAQQLSEIAEQLHGRREPTPVVGLQTPASEQPASVIHNFNLTVMRLQDSVDAIALATAYIEGGV